MSISILVADDEPDVGDLFRQRFRRETRQGTFVMHFAGSGEQALDVLAGEIRPRLAVVLSDINMPGGDKPGAAQVLKLTNNILSPVALVATAEAFVMGSRAGPLRPSGV